MRRSKRSRTRRCWRAQKRRSLGEPGQIGRATRPQKDICTTMANPTRGSWKRLEKACRYLRGVEKVTWEMRTWKNVEEVYVDVHVDSDKVKNEKERNHKVEVQ